ncbi:MAG: SRPBCC family protein [Rhodospirillales bacterium]|nr:SRPBCC family protein [Rhodospirillales bacterium]MDE0381020.1 SRPBCC family protein [Rhodospirillales bacterium]
MAYTRAKVVEEISASADRVFDEIGAFNNLTAIMPDAITRSTLNKKGNVRTLKVKGIKGTLDETLLKYDKATRTQIYRITADPDDMVPFQDYTSTIKVKPITSRRSAVEWTSRFVPKRGKTKAECLEFVEGIYRGGIQGTRDVLGVKK